MGKRLGVLTLCTLVASMMAGPLAYAGDPTLIGWWKLNEGTGNTALDLSGYGHNGTIVNPNGGLGTGGSVWFNDPERGMVLSFNGTDGTGACVNTGVIIPAMTMNNGFTWAFWAKQHANQATNNDTILGNRYGGTASPLQFIKFTPTRFELYNDDGAYVNGVNYNSIPGGTWIHHALVKDGTSLTYYRNGVATLTNKMTKTVDANPFYMGADGLSGVVEAWQGYLSDVRLYARALTSAEILGVVAGKGPGAELAGKPVPEDKATDVPRDATLNWTAGQYPATHDVYFGTKFVDVNTATRTNTTGILASKGQAETTFDPAGVFAYGQTYCWRVDEVNKTPDNTVYKGDVWSFTAEPYGYPVTPVKATASSAQTGMGPEKTIDGSGLDKSDLHGTEATTMWMSAGVAPNWIQYEFDKVYKLHQLQVWNSNQLIETYIGFGAKKVTVETSTDGTAWKALANVPEFAKATGLAGYAANTTVNLGGVEAKYVKLTITANWGGVAPQTGLAEVRFFYVPVQARVPQPATGAAGVSVEPSLTWRPGREAGSHKVFFATDANAVTNGTVAAKSVADHGYAPGSLNLGTTYYWRVDEVNTVTYPGSVWSFTTQDYKVVDDFESYTDKAGAEVFSTWIDGFADNYKSSGSTVGKDQAQNGTFGETTIFHGGRQSMPLRYDNTKAPNFSEAVRTFDTPQNWTTNGIKSLSLWFQGVAGNGGQLYVKINNTKVSYTGAATDLAKTMWTPWNIDLSAVSGNLSKVTSLTIGIEGAGAKGALYIDDIRLYPKAPAYLTPVDPGPTNLVGLWTLDGNANDTSGKGNNGTVNGTATWVPGVVNQALQFNGTSTYVDCGNGASLKLTEAVTVTAWIKMDFTAGDRKIAGNQDGTTGGYKLGLYSNNFVEFEIRTATNQSRLTRNATSGGTALQQGVWYHVAGVYIKGRGVQTYVFGNLDREFLTPDLLGSSTGSFKLGREPMSASYFWQGALDDVRVYNKVLSQEELLWLAGQTKPVAKPF